MSTRCVGNQEVVVKNVGPQLSRLPGLAGMTLLPSGAVALIYNPVALATLYGDAAREQGRQLPGAGEPVAPVAIENAGAAGAGGGRFADGAPRHAAAAGARGLPRHLGQGRAGRAGPTGDELPAVVLSDIEMPRMDGFDLVRNMRADPRLAGLPVIMITSRIAQKHRDYAAELGVNHYLGKPYSEDEPAGAGGPLRSRGGGALGPPPQRLFLVAAQPPQGGNACGPAKPVPRRLLDDAVVRFVQRSLLTTE